MEVKNRVQTFHKPWKSYKSRFFGCCEVNELIYKGDGRRSLDVHVISVCIGTFTLDVLVVLFCIIWLSNDHQVGID